VPSNIMILVATVLTTSMMKFKMMKKEMLITLMVTTNPLSPILTMAKISLEMLQTTRQN